MNKIKLFKDLFIFTLIFGMTLITIKLYQNFIENSECQKIDNNYISVERYFTSSDSLHIRPQTASFHSVKQGSKKYVIIEIELVSGGILPLKWETNIE